MIASHTQRAVWLYPTPNPPASSNSGSSSSSTNGFTNGSTSLLEDANKYRPFAVIESALLTNLQHLLATTAPSTLQHTTTTQIAGALTTALAYISKQTLLSNPVPSSAYLSPSGLPAVDNNDGTPGTRRATLTARILMLSVSGDLASQYISVMNAIFAAQRAGVAIDVLKLAGDTVFLQQACDATGGVYLRPERPQGLLQYLMMAFLPDATARRALVMPGTGGEVDFRAACFCHRRIVDVGFVCSVCLSSEWHPSLPLTFPGVGVLFVSEMENGGIGLFAELIDRLTWVAVQSSASRYPTVCA